jgi:hypothetical protein
LKTQSIQIVPLEEYINALKAKVESLHKVSKTGAKRGGTKKIAEAYETNTSTMHSVLTGYLRPTKAMLERDGLREIRVYVKSKGE